MATMAQPDGSTLHRRRSDRIFIRIPLSVIGTDRSGHDFTDRAVTEMVSRFGTSIVTRLVLSPEQEITLMPADKKPIRARVIGQTGIGPDGNVYGIAFLSTTIDFWGIRFPPLPESAGAATELECCDCHARASVSLNEVEFEVLRANDRLRHVCSQCSSVTSWRLAEAPDRELAQPSRQQRPGPELEPPLQMRPEVPLYPKVTTGWQQRMYPRVRVNMKACIAQPGSADDIVNTINISRGGVLVRSERLYPTESWIRLAVPYTPAAANIFVPARIVRRTDVPGAHEYGIKYVRC